MFVEHRKYCCNLRSAHVLFADLSSKWSLVVKKATTFGWGCVRGSIYVCSAVQARISVHIVPDFADKTFSEHFILSLTTKRQSNKSPPDCPNVQTDRFCDHSDVVMVILSNFAIQGYTGLVFTFSDRLQGPERC